MSLAPSLVQGRLLIDGELVESGDRQTMDAINPASGRVIGRFPLGTAADVELAAEAASRASAAWQRIGPLARATMVNRVAQVIEDHAEELARLDSADNGSLLTEMRKDVAAGVAALRYFAGLALQVTGSTLPGPGGEVTYTTRVPFGVVGRIVPFNHPLMFAASKIAAPLIAGNTVILKPSEHTSLSALRLAELVQPILPAGVLNIITGTGPDVGEAIVRHPLVRRLAFTGSVETGLAIQRQAAASTVKTVSLELGGKNPLVVLPDADLDVVVEAAVRGMNFTWQGQSCGSLSRIVAHVDIYDDLISKLTERVGALRPGLPDDPRAQTGAIVNDQQLERVLGYVQLGLDEGARLCVGGTRATDSDLADGLFVRPALFADVRPDSRLAQEEIFGPVLSVLRFTTEEEALRIANGTEYGLTASVFTRDLATAHRFIEQLDAGYVWVNEVSRHIAGAPYGGTKNSGIGREEDLGELLSYTQVKNVHINFG